jgi:hypothetical protein
MECEKFPTFPTTDEGEPQMASSCPKEFSPSGKADNTSIGYQKNLFFTIFTSLIIP